jgi:hypothetical protein
MFMAASVDPQTGEVGTPAALFSTLDLSALSHPDVTRHSLAPTVF